MAACITELAVSVNESDEKKLQSEGFQKILYNLNEGTGGNSIHLWYKAVPNAPPITRLQITFNEHMFPGLINAGYTQIQKDLNTGTKGDNIYLWFFRGNTEYDTPIEAVDVTINAESEAQKLSFGWERLNCDVNRNARGNWVHIWVRRQKQTYICDVSATDNFGSDTDYFNGGYIRVDEDTNRNAGGVYVFIWYRQTTDPKRALNDLQISNNRSDYQAFQQQHYHQVKTDLNEGTKGDQVYIWTKKDKVHNPIKSLILLLNPDAFKVYRETGVDVIEKNLNSGNKGSVEYLSVYQ